MPSSAKKPKPKVESKAEISVSRAPNHTKYYVTNIAGGMTDQDFRFELLNEKLRKDEENEWEYVSDGLIILSPFGAKKLFLVLKDSLDVWENEKGKIDTEQKDKHIIDFCESHEADK